MTQSMPATKSQEARKQVSLCLQAIREKEEQIRLWALDAKRRADDLVAKAREEASLIKQKAQEEAKKEAEALRRQKLGEAEEEARKIISSTGEQVRAVREQARRKMEIAVQTVISVVLSE